ncbi:hypothetical protein D020_0037A, partial [Vibrio parahaemolyticus SBR10290]
MNQSGEE